MSNKTTGDENAKKPTAKRASVKLVLSKADPEVEKQIRIKKALDDAAAILDKEKVKYFLGAIDAQPNSPDGGKAFVQSDITGNDFCYILDLALPTNQDLVNVGIYIGQVIQARNKKPVTLKGN